METYLQEVLERHAAVTDGAVATYIPELACADPDWFGISVAMLDGTVYEVGDTRQAFTMQSLSKPLVFGLALDEHGEQAVRSRVGVEPTGDGFNATSLSASTGKPMNPMVNSGALAISGMLTHTTLTAEEQIWATLSRYVGHQVSVDDTVRASESATGHRNRALAHLLRGAGAIEGDPEIALQAYLMQCSVLVDCHDMAVTAGTLANGGVNPVSGQRAAGSETVRSILSVMTSCGMYDGAGEWLYSVGLPAKSGVSGCILAVLPGQLGIAVFSPPLDIRGNSVRGIGVCRDLVRDLDLHLLASGPPASSVLGTATLAQAHVSCPRPASERLVLAGLGDRVVVQTLAAILAFPAVAAVTKRLEDSRIRFAVLDMRRVDHAPHFVVGLLARLRNVLLDRGGELVLVGAAAPLSADFRIAAYESRDEPIATYPDLEAALEWCEERLLETVQRS